MRLELLALVFRDRALLCSREMDETRLVGQRIPSQTLARSQRVALRYDSGDYDGHNFLRAGLRGTVLGYATPEIQRRQIWPRDSY
jgi:hypothetical protein